mmetsp:Transcript_11604/g.17037  ORF Transcript_11604/g.17037 Transcript_11604/m.17037 type:complete len:288 (-) Transcript_11604:145-1008(-)
MSSGKRINRMDVELGLFEQISLKIDDNDFIVEYACRAPTVEPLNTESVSFFYDLIFPESEDPDFVRKQFESHLLKQIAIRYGLIDGTACISPKVDGALHLLQTSIAQEEKETGEIKSCVMLATTGVNQICASYLGTVSVNYVSQGDMNNLMNFIADTISDGIVTSGSLPLLKAEFLGTRLQPHVTENSETASKKSANKQNLTWIGGVVAAVLTLVMLGILLPVWKRRQNRQKIHKSTEDSDELKEEKLDRIDSFERELEEDGRSWFSAPSSSSSFDDESVDWCGIVL